jgi:hypothetical protein
MKKIQVNNKPLNKEKQTEHLRIKRLKKKFKSNEDLMEYVEKLEERIKQLEIQVSKISGSVK